MQSDGSSNRQKKARNGVGVFVPVSAVFPNVKSDFATFKSLLQNLSLTDTLFWCARLNLEASSSEETNHLKKQQSCVQKIFATEEIRRIDHFARQQRDPKNISVFFRGQLLELIRWAALFCDDLPGDGTTHENPEVRRRFAQAALLASDIWSARVIKDRLSLNGGIDNAREKALGAIRKGIEAIESAPHTYRSIGRGWCLFNNYFPRHYKSFHEEFRSLTHITVENYYVYLTAVMICFMNYMRENGIFRPNLEGASKASRDIFEKLISLISQAQDELRDSIWGRTAREISRLEDAPPYYYKALREKPVLNTGDGRAIILDPIFYSEKAMVGPLFILAKQKPEHKANEIFTAFGNSFEDYACDILQRMFPDLSCITSRRLSVHIKKVDLGRNEVEIDACLNDVVEAVIFEMKAVWIRDDEILTDNYLQHLREKYVSDEKKTGNRKSKGLSQLARIINLIASQEWTAENLEFSQVKLVYPVLVVHDLLLSAPVYGSFLASEFKAKLAPDRELCDNQMIKGNLRIAPLIVMTIEDLENLEESMKHFGFRDLLADYSQSHPDRNLSLHNFIALSKYSNKMNHSQILSSKTIELCDKAEKAIFYRKSGRGRSKKD
jgi:hypothetical protein